jgi:hypothetical protein
MVTEQADYSESKMTKFVENLARATEHNRIEWLQVGSNPDTYAASFPRNSIMVWSIDDDGQHPFRLVILDSNGQTIETVETLRQGPEGQPHLFARIAELYQAARKQVRNIDAILDDMLNELGDV